MQVSFLFVTLMLIFLVALILGSIILVGAYGENKLGNKLLRQSQKINRNNQYRRYQDETRAWQRHR